MPAGRAGACLRKPNGRASRRSSRSWATSWTRVVSIRRPRTSRASPRCMATYGNGPRARIPLIPVSSRSAGPSANTTASSWPTSWCCAADAASPPRTTCEPATATSSIPTSAGNSRGSGSRRTPEMSRSPALSVMLRDYEPRQDRMRLDVLTALSEEQKTLPCKYFYDARGSELFDAICELPEYYLTRTELGIMETHVAEMAAALGTQLLLVEPGKIGRAHV